MDVSILDPDSSYDDSTNFFCGPRSYSIDSISPPAPDIVASSSVVVSTLNPRGLLSIAPLTVAETNIQFTVTIKATLIDFPTVSSTLNVAIEFVHTCEGPDTNYIPNPGLSLSEYAPLTTMTSFIGASLMT